MKTLKNDTRYIIKKVIIGVLIAIVLFNARKCGVYALESDYYFWGSNVSGVNVSTQLNVCTSTLNSCYTEIDTIDYNGSKLHFYLQNRYKGTYNTSNIWFYEYNNELYFFGFFANQNTLSNYDYDHINIEKNSTYNYSTAPPNFRLMKNDSIVANIGSIDNAVSYLKNYFYKIDFSVIDKSASFLSAFTSNSNSSGGLLMNDILENGSFIATNSSVPLYYNNINITAPSFPPTGYSEISLKDYQGVVIIPKNYDNIDCSIVGDLCNTTFTYYYEKEIKEAYFPLDNRFDIRFNSDTLNSPSEPTEKDTYFPLYQNVSNNKYYYAFLIYNYTNDGTPLDPNNYYAYGSAKIWIDTTKWDYYLVEDFSTWSQEICYYVGQNQICTTISGLPTLREAIEEADQQELIDSFSPTSSNVILEFLKLPFNFLRGLSPDRCVNFDLPFPHIGNIRLYCLSDTFHDVMGNYYNTIAIIINGFLLYRFTLMNIKTFKECSDADNDKLEVVDL